MFDFFSSPTLATPRAFSRIETGVGLDAVSMIPGGQLLVAALSSSKDAGREDSSQIMTVYSRESVFQDFAPVSFSLNGTVVSQAVFFRALLATSVFEAGETAMSIVGLSFAEDGRMFVLIHERFERFFSGSASRVLVFDTIAKPNRLLIEISSRHLAYEVGTAMSRMIGRDSRPSSMVFDEVAQSLRITSQTRISRNDGVAAEFTHLWSVSVPGAKGSASWGLSLSENVNNSPMLLPRNSRLACAIGDSILYVARDSDTSQASVPRFVELFRLRSTPRQSPILRIGSR